MRNFTDVIIAGTHYHQITQNRTSGRLGRTEEVFTDRVIPHKAKQRIRSDPGALFAFIPVGNDTFSRLFFLILEQFSNQKTTKVEQFSNFFKNLTEK